MKLNQTMKISICLRLARILNTLHSLSTPLAHGSITSHNLLFDLDFEGDPMKPFKLYLAELELHDFKKYANMFGNYRCASVWSSPECLKQPRKKLDPLPEMDVYSFGMLMWEVFHQTVPFDGDLKVCTEYVVNSESRPKIDEENGTIRGTEMVEEDRNAGDGVSDGLADIIRLCWQTD
jgi:hypothetical protein